MNNSNSNSNLNLKINKNFTIKLIIILLLLVIFICILIKVSSDISYDSVHENSKAIKIIEKDRNADRIGNRLDSRITRVFSTNKTSNFSISTWVYIEDWNFGNNKYKIILEETDTDDNLNMIIALDKNDNNLIFGIRINKPDSSDGEMTYYIYENIKTQKWINIIYVIKNTMVELFIDGLLTQRNEISNNNYNGEDFNSSRNISKNYVKNITYKLIKPSEKKLKLLPFNRDDLENMLSPEIKSHYGFKGKISKLYYFGTDIQSSKAKEIYEDGPY